MFTHIIKWASRVSEITFIPVAGDIHLRNSPNLWVKCVHSKSIKLTCTQARVGIKIVISLILRQKNITTEQCKIHRDALSVILILQKPSRERANQVQQGLNVAFLPIVVFLWAMPATTALSPSNEKQKHTNNRLLMVLLTSAVSPLSPLFRVRSPAALSATGMRVLPCVVPEVVSAGRPWSLLLSPSPSDRRVAPAQSCAHF